MIDIDQVVRHTLSLGIGEEEEFVVACFPPKGKQGGGCKYFKRSAKGDWGAVETYLNAHPGYALGFIQNPGGTHNDEIEWCRALFFEIDDPSIPMEEQMGHPEAIGLPKPSLQVWTGGKSVHHYFLLEESISGSTFRAAQKQLFRQVKSALGVEPDGTLCNPSRILRLAGGVHPKTGNRSTVLSSSGEKFSLKRIVDVEKLEEREPRKSFIKPQTQELFIPSMVVPLPERGTEEYAAFEARQAAYDRDEKPTGCQPWTMSFAEKVQTAVSALPFCPERLEEGSGTYQDAWPILASLVHTFGVDTALDIIKQAGWSPLFHDVEEQAEGVASPNYKGPRYSIFHLFSTAEYNGWPRTWSIEKRISVNGNNEEDDELARELRREGLNQWITSRAATFSLEAVFPPKIAEMLGGRADVFPVAHTAMLGPFLATMASVIGKSAKVKLKEGYCEPLIIWIGTVAPASSLKTPVSKQFLRPLQQIDYAANRKYKEQIKKWKASEKSGEAPELPPQRVVMDATLEGLCQLLDRDCTNGVISYHDELASFIGDMDKYRSHSSDRSRWLEMWSGNGFNILRKSADPVLVEETAVSVFGSIQQEKLRDIISGDNGATQSGDGFWARFLWVVPPYVFPKQNKDSSDITAQLAELIENLNALSGVTLTLSDEAWDVWCKVADGFSEEAMATYGARAAFLGKLRGYFARFAGLLHLLDLAVWGDTLTPEIPKEINGETMQRAAVLAQFFLNQFDVLAPEIGGSDLPGWVTKIISLAETDETGDITPRKVMRAKYASTSSEATEMLKSLVSDYGMGELKTGKRRDQIFWRKG